MPTAEAEANVQVVKAAYEAFAARDVDAMLRYVDPDCEFRPVGTAALSGRDEPYRGHEGMRRYFADLEANWDELVIEPQDYRAAGSSVIVFGHVTGRGPQAEVDAPATWVWKLRDSLAVDVRVFPSGGDALRWLDENH